MDRPNEFENSEVELSNEALGWIVSIASDAYDMFGRKFNIENHSLPISCSNLLPRIGYMEGRVIFPPYVLNRFKEVTEGKTKPEEFNAITVTIPGESEDIPPLRGVPWKVYLTSVFIEESVHHFQVVGGISKIHTISLNDLYMDISELGRSLTNFEVEARKIIDDVLLENLGITLWQERDKLLKEMYPTLYGATVRMIYVAEQAKK